MPGGPSTSRLNRPVRALLFGLALGLAGTALELSSAGMSLEEDLALRWLFRLRGPLPPPQDVALIAIDRASQRKLGLPRQYRQWPRHRHTQLIERLIAAGPRLLVFDIFFAERHDDDAAFADALQRAGHVLLAQRIETERSHPGGRDGPMLEIETLVDPSAPLTAAATAVAPFVLPAAPQRVSQFWTFKPECGDAPTLPTVAFQLHVLELYPALRELLIAVDPPRFADLPPSLASRPASAGLIETMRRLRGAFRADPRLYAAALAAAQSRGAFSSAERTRLVTLLDLYAAEHSRYLKYYGPPATVEPLSFERVLTMDDGQLRHGLRDKAVFVGVSAVQEAQQEDVFYTAYPGEGQDILVSGVEIAATAYANLVRNESIHPLGPARLSALLLAWGLLVGALAQLLAPRQAIPVILLLAAAYSLLVYQAFVHLDLWLPWVVPIGVQALPALVLGLWLGYRAEWQAKRRIAAALDRYLPAPVAAELAADVYRAGIRGKVLKGVCIATDGEQYTTLAERLRPHELHALLNDYYAVVFEPIRRSAGFVSDVVGDSCLGLWIGAGSGTMAAERRRGCEAAIDILEAVRAFNAARPDGGIPIRIGLHFGEVFLGDVGAANHYEYRAVGDVVNTASRIEQASKKLGTRLLVSAAVMDGIDALMWRDLGLFQLAGKRNPIHLYELLGRTAAGDEQTTDFVHDFARALAAMQRGEWTQARDGFTALLRRRPDDGPSHFFAGFCHDCIRRPPPEGRGIVRFDTK